MSSDYIVNEAITDPSKLLSGSDPFQELSITLQDLVRSYPPFSSSGNPYKDDELQELYSGPTSIAYLFLVLSKHLPYLKLDDKPFFFWANAYLVGGRGQQSVSAGKNGVSNEFLAYNAVYAAVNNHDISTAKLVVRKIIEVAVNIDESDESITCSDDWLHGRAGCLYLLRLIRSYVPGMEGETTYYIEVVMAKILITGPSWPWRGIDYLGKQRSDTCILPTVNSICFMGASTARLFDDGSCVGESSSG